jgi:hypothetical protein
VSVLARSSDRELKVVGTVFGVMLSLVPLLHNSFVTADFSELEQYTFVFDQKNY